MSQWLLTGPTLAGAQFNIKHRSAALPQKHHETSCIIHMDAILWDVIIYKIICLLKQQKLKEGGGDILPPHVTLCACLVVLYPNY